MQITNLLTDIEFHAANPYAQPLLVDQYGRILRFALQPGQRIHEHSVPGSPFYVVVLKGHGRFIDQTGASHDVGPMSLLTFAPDEKHTVEAFDEELVFVGFLQGVPGTRPDHSGGELSRGD